MYVLYTDSKAALAEQALLFDRHLEPLLQNLDAANRQGRVPDTLPEIAQYLEVCRWPFRKLEYAFALDALLRHLQPGSRYLDAGSGVTPLAHAVASRGVQADACDAQARLIDELRRFEPEKIYASQVTYTAQDLTALSFPDETFDAVSCISVLEHIPAPADQRALRELMRVLKPGGLLVLTVDFTPAAPDGGRQSATRHYADRLFGLIRQGDMREIGRAITRKVQARQAITHGAARYARSANQCFELAHLEHDILPCLSGDQAPSAMPFAQGLRSVTPEHARGFWDLEPGLYNNQGRRAVLPAAYLGHKAPVQQ